MASRLIRNADDMDAWYPAVGYEGRLEITRSGRVRGCERRVPSRYGSTRRMPTREINPFPYNSGYPTVQIRIEGKRKNLLVHRLVADAFIPNPQRKPFVNHIDGDKANNHVSNLEWCTHLENMRHAYRTGLTKVPDVGPGERSPAAKLNWDKVRHIRALLKDGARQKDVADLFGVSAGTVGFIAKNETWRVEA